ncbi:MAG: beta-lactamase family protein [Betaproteobacteria bacterium]|nr:beta-lactamase family protein [Betaproteobacteria bacterium]
MKRLLPLASVTFLACLLAACASPKPPPPPFSGDSLRDIDTAIYAAIEQKKLPSAVYHLERMGRMYEKAYGRFDYDENVTPIGTGTLFDVASLTKVVATTPSVLILVEEGKLSLDARLIEYFPECANGGKEVITLRHLLTHVSGLPAGIPAKPPWSGKAAALDLACRQVVTDAPGSKFRYSDINFLLLGMLVEKVSGLSLADFATPRVYKPLGMKDTVFRPQAFVPLRYTAADIAPTQIVTEESLQIGLHQDLAAGDVLRGTVHDPTARLMGGVAGSAGLFTTARDLALYARMLLNGGELDGVRVLSRESVRLMSTVQTPPTVRERRAIGFDIDSPYSRPRGTLFPIGSYDHPGSFGHTGFTGCVLWIDPASQSFYIFLSNRVYPRDGAGIVPLYATLGTLSANAIASGGFDFAKVRGLAPQAPVAP